MLSHKNPQTLYNNANLEINKLYNWFSANNLSLNAGKTKYIVIREPYYDKSDITGLSLSINGVPLSQIGNAYGEKSTKFLGIYIDEFLTWNHHLTHINNKISRALFMIRQAKHFLPVASLRTLYFAMIHPHISYGILAWGNATQTTLKRTITLQKRALRTINNVSYNSHTDPLFKKSNILKLNDLFDHESGLFMHNYVMNKLPESFGNMFTFNYEIQERHQTRQSSLLYLKRCNSKFAKKLPLYDFPERWNKWNQRLENINSQGQYKKKSKNYFLSSYMENVKCANLYCKDCHKN